MMVYVECYHDTALVRALGRRRRDIGHEYSKGNVLNRVRKSREQAIGLVDADPDAPSPAELVNYREAQSAHSLRMLEHRQDPDKKIVEIRPRLEEWLVDRAKKCSIQLRDYDLPETAHEMHGIARCDLKPKFRLFLDDLLKKDDGMRALKKWLCV